MALSATLLADFSSFMTATKDAVAAVQGFKESAEELGPAADRGLSATEKQAEQIGRQLYRVGQDAVAASQTFIAAFAEEQEAVGRLTTALEATGQASPAVIEAYAAMATQFQNTTKYADEAITNTQAVLTTIGKVGPEQMELALEAVTNLASGMKIDLATAATMVAKAVGSGGESLGKLKVILGDAYQPGMDAAQMLQAINEKFGSAATNEMQTYGGQIAQLQNHMSDFQETIGKVFVDHLSTLFHWFQELPAPIQAFTLAVVAIGTAAAPVLVSISSLVSLLATAGVGSAMVAGIGSVIAILTGPVGLAIAAGAVLAAVVANWDKIVAATQQLYLGVKAWLVDKLAGVWTWVQAKLAEMTAAFQRMYQAVVGGSIVPDMIAGIEQEFAQLDRVMVQPARAATEAVINSYDKMRMYEAAANAIYARTQFYTSASQNQQVAEAAARIFGGGGGGGGGAVTINNTFHVNGTGQEVARIVMDEITRIMKSGRKFPSA